jgi:hypothetical protein
MQMPPLRLLTSPQIVDDHFIGSKFLRKENGIAFTIVEIGLQSSKSGLWVGTQISSHRGGAAIHRRTLSDAPKRPSSSHTEDGTTSLPYSFGKMPISPIRIR